MKPNRLALLTILTIIACVPLALAQTNGAGKAVVLQGQFKSIDWSNPQVQLHLDVQIDNGRTEHWLVVGDAPGSMLQSGLARDGLRSGDAIIVCGHRHSDLVLDGGGIALVDGRTVFFGGAANDCRQAGGSPQPTPTASARAPLLNSPVQPFVNSPVQPFVSSPVTAFGVPPVVAGGGFATASDTKKPVILQGVIQNVNRTASTMTLDIDVPDGSGRSQRWVIAGDAPKTMSQELQRGAPVIVCGAFPSAPTPTRQSNAQVLVPGGLAFADGRTIYFGQAADTCQGTVVPLDSVFSPNTQQPQPVSPSKNVAPVVNSPVQPFVNPPVPPFGTPPR